MRDKISKRYVGDLFVNKGQSGHLMNQHYLDVMFSKEDSPFLELVVHCDEETMDERQKGTVTVVNTEAIEKERPEPNLMEEMGASRLSGGEAWSPAEKQMGKTVRDLSRLWRYRNGGSP